MHIQAYFTHFCQLALQICKIEAAMEYAIFELTKLTLGMYFDFLTKPCCLTLFQNLSDEFSSAYHVEYDVQWVETLSKGT